jgi:hypothetical protein
MAWKYLTPQSQGKSVVLVMTGVPDDAVPKIVPPYAGPHVIHFEGPSHAESGEREKIVLSNYSVGVACVVCNGKSLQRTVPMEELNRIINSGGGICFFISKRGAYHSFQKFLELHDFEFMQAYAVLPNFGNPRWIIPLCSRFLTSSAKSIFKPTKPSKRLLWKFIVKLSHLGLFSLLARDRLIIAKKKGAIKRTKKGGFRELIEDLFGKRDIEMALLARPGKYYQKTTAQVMDQTGRILAFVKIGTTSQAKRLLENEARALKELEQLNLRTVEIAQLIYWGEIDHDTIVVQSAKYPLKPGPVYLSAKHISFFTEIFNKTAKAWRFEESPFSLSLQEDLQGIHGLDSSEWAALLQVAVGEIRHRFEGQYVRLGFAHGDFAPWNTCLSDKGQLVVFDWELSFKETVPLLDFYNFIIHVEAFLRHKRADEILTTLLHERGPYFESLNRYRTATGADSAFDHVGFLLIYLYKTSIFYLNYRNLQEQAGFDADWFADEFLSLLWTMLDKLLRLR